MAKKILIIEGAHSTTHDLKTNLSSMGFQIIESGEDISNAITLADSHKPDMIVADVTRNGRDYDGIDVVNRVNRKQSIPVIYLTDHTESLILKLALSSHPVAILLKPFRFANLITNIEVALKKLRLGIGGNNDSNVENGSIFLPVNYTYERVRKRDIVFVQADGSYSEVVMTNDRQYKISINLKKFNTQLNDIYFMRISRKHIVNTQFVSKVNGDNIFLEDEKYKISIYTLKKFLKLIPVLKTS